MTKSIFTLANGDTVNLANIDIITGIKQDGNNINFKVWTGSNETIVSSCHGGLSHDEVKSDHANLLKAWDEYQQFLDNLNRDDND